MKPLLAKNLKKAEVTEKEKIEMTEKDDSGDSEKKKDKKKKKEPKPKGPSCIDTMSDGLNLKERDDKAINTEIDVSNNCNFLLIFSFQVLDEALLCFFTTSLMTPNLNKSPSDNEKLSMGQN